MFCNGYKLNATLRNQASTLIMIDVSLLVIIAVVIYITSTTAFISYRSYNPLAPITSSSSSLSYYVKSLQRCRRYKVARRPLQVYGNGKFSENSMSIDEIKAELELRGVDYQDCISKNELVQRLVETRVSGKANPDILKSMQTQSSDDILISELDDDVLDQATAKDGNLPGGMSKDMLKALSGDPEIMRMLKDPKMQDIMGAVMTGGPDAIKKYLSDPGSWYF